MPAEEDFREQPIRNRDSFVTTRWSIVRQAGGGDSPEAQSALATLCQSYWYPLYVFVRRQGQSPEDAQDLVQGFFAQVLAKNYVSSADQEKGRFRSFLLIALKRYMANQWDRFSRQKRGGGKGIISLDEQKTEMQYLAEPGHEMTPEKAFERRWAITVLERATSRLEAEFRTSGREVMFEEMRVFLSGEKGRSSYSELGRKFGMSEGAFKVAVHRMRGRYRELLRDEVSNTVEKKEEVDDEIRYLFATLG